MDVVSYTIVTLERKCEQTILKNTDGSALYSEGDTNVLVGLYGPADCKESRQDVSEAVVEVNFRPKIGIPALAEKYLEQFIKSISKTIILRSLHPRSVFSIIVQVMQDQGSLLSCAINGVSMALQDAGVAMSCLPVAVTVALCEKTPEEDDETEPGVEIIVNPRSSVEQSALALMTFVFDSAKMQLLSTRTLGSISPAKYEESLNLAKEASGKTLSFFRESISKKMSIDIR